MKLFEHAVDETLRHTKDSIIKKTQTNVSKKIVFSVSLQRLVVIDLRSADFLYESLVIWVLEYDLL